MSVQPAVITISREMASGGAYIGHLIARRLGYKYVEREVLFQAAEELGADIRDVSQQDERRAGFVENLMKSFLFGTPEAAYIPPARRAIYDYDLFQSESRIIRTIADRYNAVIVGRAGYAILRDHPHALHVFLHAPLDFRVQRLQSFHHISSKEARSEIEESDRQREKYLKSMTGTDRYDSRNYHLCIDVAASGFDMAVTTIIDLLKKMSANTAAR